RRRRWQPRDRRQGRSRRPAHRAPGGVGVRRTDREARVARLPLMFWKRGPTGPFADGEEIKIAGKVVATDLVEAPLSGRQVAAWAATIKVPTPREGPLLMRAVLYPVRDGIDAVRAAASSTHTIAGPIAIVSR